MQSLGLSFRRLYVTMPDAAKIARTSSTPRAVRMRRLGRKERKSPLPIGQSDATPTGLTPTEAARYKRLAALGQLPNQEGTRQLTDTEWLEVLNARRTRIRGLREKKMSKENGGEIEEVIVGKKVYLPNVIFRMVRNQTPPGEPYNPYEATFRVPRNITKTDIRSYLHSIYGVAVTYIRTDNYISPLYRTIFNSKTTRSYRTYKRAVVGLVEPFYYPQMTEDMSQEDREAREQWMENNFALKAYEEMRKHEYLRLTKKSSKDWRWTSGSPQRGKILKRIADVRAAREESVKRAKDLIVKNRALGDPIIYNSVSARE
ncbi:hypothetical protein JAAARDRAFT_41867 [Jaapia argillacea MUCL 33604]|uniref:Large ribosomal subunit protein uL23m n=1 Tax=Jaapia argillacea MUCL 33604 TaxID=933084 RepID=A0A067PAA7_9AGAM|nr:hypothetical protein JAAARDRAFT_41867 [Jaapia argillacea MUCL 33604]